MKLGEVYEVRSGLVLSRKQAKHQTPYQYHILTLRAIQDHGYVDLEKVEIGYMTERLSAEYITRSGDLVIRLTSPYTAVLIDDSTSDMVVSSNFLILRAKYDFLLPEYLYWFLNTEAVRQKIYEQSTSNMLGAVKKQTFVELELSLLPISAQKKIGEIHLLAQRESQLLRELAEEKEAYYSRVLNKIHDTLRREWE